MLAELALCRFLINYCMSVHIRFQTLHDFDLAVTRLAVSDVAQLVKVQVRVYTMNLDRPGLYAEFEEEHDLVLFALVWDGKPYSIIE